MGILIIFSNNLLLTSILLFYFCVLILNFNFHFKSIIFYVFSLIFIGRLFLLILFVLSIRRLVLPRISFANFILLILVLILLILYNFNFILNFKFSDFNLSLNFVIILGFVILLVFCVFIILLF